MFARKNCFCGDFKSNKHTSKTGRSCRWSVVHAETLESMFDESEPEKVAGQGSGSPGISFDLVRFAAHAAPGLRLDLQL